jgi:hypothetical protein
LDCFAAIVGGGEVWAYAVLVTSLSSEILTMGQLYRDRADCENGVDELKNHWRSGGFTTHDLKRCRLMAQCGWNLFVRLADPDHHREAITSRPLLLQAIGRQTSHAGRTTVTTTSSHGEHHHRHGRPRGLRVWEKRRYSRGLGWRARVRDA